MNAPRNLRKYATTSPRSSSNNTPSHMAKQRLSPQNGATAQQKKSWTSISKVTDRSEGLGSEGSCTDTKWHFQASQWQRGLRIGKLGRSSRWDIVSTIPSSKYTALRCWRSCGSRDIDSSWLKQWRYHCLQFLCSALLGLPEYWRGN